jgi:Rieske Fe-S protein
MSPEPLSRRSTLRGLAVGVAGALAGFVVARSSRAAAPGPLSGANSYGPPAGGGRLLARADDVVAGGGVVLTDAQVVLTRGTDGTVHAFSAVCTHQGCPVASVKEGEILCPCHGSRFDATTGAVVTGPARRSLPVIPVVVRDGGVYTT